MLYYCSVKQARFIEAIKKGKYDYIVKHASSRLLSDFWAYYALLTAVIHNQYAITCFLLNNTSISIEYENNKLIKSAAKRDFKNIVFLLYDTYKEKNLTPPATHSPLQQILLEQKTRNTCLKQCAERVYKSIGDNKTNLDVMIPDAINQIILQYAKSCKYKISI